MRHLKQAFREADTDNNGYIDRDEMRNFMLENSDESMRNSTTSFDDIFASIDRNNDGKVSWTEFITAGMNKSQLLSDGSLSRAFNHLDSGS